jgi:hypothetical protein
MTITEQAKIINAAWKAAGNKGNCPMPEASSPEVWDIGGITIEPYDVEKKSIVGTVKAPGYFVTAWNTYYDPESGPDVCETTLGQFHTFSDAVIYAFSHLMEDKIKNAVEAEGMAMACAE